MRSMLSSAVAAALLLAPASAQTFTECNPLKRSCPADHGLNKKHWEVDFVRQGAKSMKDFKVTAGTISHGSKGAGFTIKNRGDAPTMQTKFNIFFGHVEATMIAAPGQGVISSFILESDDLDEIDWEFVGSDTANGQSNFFGKGNTTTYDRGAYHPVSGPQLEKHRYGIDWTKERVQWLVDGKVVRTVHSTDALALRGKNFPQTPMTIRMGIWAGGDASNSPGTVQWAGGPINYGAGPYSMYISKISVTNYNPAPGYKYKNKSGSWKSIQKLRSAPKGGHAADSGARSHGPQVKNGNKPGPYEAPVPPQVTTSAPTYIPYTSAPYPVGNSTIVTAPGSTGGITYHPTSTLGSTPVGSSTPTAAPTGAANALTAKIGGAVVGLVGAVALL